MAVPKRKTANARRDKRRANYKASPVKVVPCPNCKEPKLPHVVCPKCGMYKGKQYIAVEEA